eukprot:scaffold12477_cov119-Isochrysis_galbana.AAC.5
MSSASAHTIPQSHRPKRGCSATNAAASAARAASSATAASAIAAPSGSDADAGVAAAAVSRTDGAPALLRGCSAPCATRHAVNAASLTGGAIACGSVTMPNRWKAARIGAATRATSRQLHTTTTGRGAG